jgi:hypothetical protein
MRVTTRGMLVVAYLSAAGTNIEEVERIITG